MEEEIVIRRPFTTVKNYDPKVKAEAYDRFLNTDMDLTDVAIAVGVPRAVVSAWSREGGWLKRKEELELEFMRSAEAKYRSFFLEHKLPTMMRHIETARMIEEQIAKVLKQADKDGEVIDSHELRRLSEALASVTNVSARAVGLTDKMDVNAAKQDPAGGKRPLIAIGIAPKLAKELDVTTVETTCEDVSERKEGDG